MNNTAYGLQRLLATYQNFIMVEDEILLRY